MTTSEVLLTAKNIGKRYPSAARSALHDVSLELKRGQVIALVGPSGSGKTSLLRCLAGLESIDRGSIEIGGNTVRAGSPNDLVVLRQRSSYVFQDYNLWRDKTVLQNIILAPMLVHHESRTEAVANAKALLKKFDLADKADTYPDFLSGGQQQRVAIIRALAMKPEILYLDEITSALDPELVSSVLGVIKVLAKEGQSMVLATHHLKFATEVADTILFLERGKVLQQATSRDFIYAQKNPRIAEFLKTLSAHKNEITVYEGYDQWQAFQLGTLKRFRRGAVKHVVASGGDRWFHDMGTYYEQYETERAQKEIVWKMIMYQESPLDRDLRLRQPQLNIYRIIPKKIKQPANYYVIEDEVVIQIFAHKGEDPALIVIKNAAVAESYLNYFNLLWEQGKDPK